MPPYRFSGLVPVTYPETRDARDRSLGTVKPGDERDFEQAPDQWWVPAGDGDSAGDGESAAPAGQPEPAAGETAPEPPPAPGPVPAPPAVIPQ